MRVLNDEDSGFCEIDPEEVADNFSVLPTECPTDTSFLDHPCPSNVEIETTNFHPSEVRKKLFKLENTSPGLDRITYRHWREVDPDAKVLSVIFNICLKARRIPSTWKSSRTVLLFKKGDRSVASNWRPISLGNTIYKLYAGCLANRVTRWMTENNILSSCQKGFLPFDGVYENNFILETRMKKHRSGKKDLFLATLDLSNAFGSVPHWAVITSFQKAGAGNVFTDILEDLYSNVETTYVTTSGSSLARRIMAGVRQGCPLSGPAFNMTIDFMLRGIQGTSADHDILAYADDMSLLANTNTVLQSHIDTVTLLASKINLKFNPKICITLHVSQVPPAGAHPSVFFMDGVALPFLRDGESTMFLGKPIGSYCPSDVRALGDLKKKADNIMESKLAPWQRLNALKTFFYPSLLFAMRTAQFKKTEWASIDKHLRPKLKKTLGIPANAANEYLYGSTGAGLFGIPIAAEDSDIALIDGAFKLLTCNDIRVRDIAWAELTEIASKKFPVGNLGLDEKMSNYLSNTASRINNPISSHWTRARQASKRLNAKWELSRPAFTSVAVGDTTVTDRRQVFATFRKHIRSNQELSLARHPHQGKTFPCFSADKASSHFHAEGAYTRFAEWRFVHKARLGLVPLNAYTHNNNQSKKCRKCQHDETLPHVLCHCMGYSVQYVERHNKICRRIKNAASGRWTVRSENQVIGSGGLKPDLVLAKENCILIIDVICPFENGLDAFSAARATKMLKYTPLANELRNATNNVQVAAVVVGTLGSWDPDNDDVLKRICSKKYAKLLKKLIVSDTLRGSRDVYTEHVTGVRQATWRIGGNEDNGS